MAPYWLVAKFGEQSLELFVVAQNPPTGINQSLNVLIAETEAGRDQVQQPELFGSSTSLKPSRMKRCSTWRASVDSSWAQRGIVFCMSSGVAAL